MSLVTVNNLYENGVCDEFTIYTGTTYNGDPYIIPVSAQSIGSHSLPHTFDVGGYEGPLYIFLVHCDFYVTPPPSETPKRQGGFQVKLINIDCENCPPFSPVATPSPTSTPNATPTTDCDFTVNFVEYTIVVSDTDVFLNDSGSPTSIYSYNPNTTVLTYLYDSTNGSSDIANTSNKLWVYNGGGGSLLEYDITLSPFSQTYNRTITSVYLNAGLCAIDDTTLININGSNVYEIDITTNVASPTLKWSTISGRAVAGDYMYTTTNKLIITNNSSSGAHITQYDYTTGTVEVDLDITATIPQPYGVFEYVSEIYIVNSNGEVYQIMGSSPYTLTLVDDIAITVYGASQIPSKITEDFTPVTESTPTPTPTPSPTPDATPVATPNATPAPTPNATPAPTPQPTDVGGPPQFSDAQIEKNVCITNSNTVTQTGTVTLTEATEFRVIAEAYTEDLEEDYLTQPQLIIGTTGISVEAQMRYGVDDDTVEEISPWTTIQPGVYNYRWIVETQGITGNGCGSFDHRSA